MTAHSPAPGTPQSPRKAIVTAIVGFAVAVGGYYVADDDPFTRKELVEAFLLGLAGGGLTGSGAYFPRNRAR